MSPSTAPPFCSLTRTARIVPLTRPQIVTFCAMTLPSTCAPSLIWRSEARNSPSIRPKICAGPSHSILPTIDMSEPMQEAVPAFVSSDLAQVWSCGCTVLPMTSAAFAAAFLSFSGTPLFVLFNISTSFILPARSAGTGGLAATCSTTECCCCTILSMTSAVFAAAFLSFSGALLLKNMSTSVFARMPCRKRLRLSCRDQPQAEGLFRLGCRLRIGLRKPELPLRWSLRVRAIPCTVPCQGFHFPTIRASHHHPYDVKSAISVPRLFCEEEFGQLWSMGTRTFQKACDVAFQSHELSGAPPPLERCQAPTRGTPRQRRWRVHEFLHVVQIRQMLLLLTESENLLPLTRIFMECSGALFDIDDVENSVLTLCGH